MQVLTIITKSGCVKDFPVVGQEPPAVSTDLPTLEVLLMKGRSCVYVNPAEIAALVFSEYPESTEPESGEIDSGPTF